MDDGRPRRSEPGPPHPGNRYWPAALDSECLQLGAQKPTLRPQTSPETDWEVLAALYNATVGPNWKDNDNWLNDAPIGEWHGITTDGNGRVIELDLARILPVTHR